MRLLAGTLVVWLVSSMTVIGRQSAVFVDAFEDGNTDGWWLGHSHHTPWLDGNWRLENGTLAQDAPGDAFIALAGDVVVADQSIATDVRMNGPAGYGGLTVWYADASTWVGVFLYPAAHELWVLEKESGIDRLTRYSYPAAAESVWYRLGVLSDAATGVLAVSVNNAPLLTHAVATSVRLGRSGLYSGNSGGAFDNFERYLFYPARTFRGFFQPVENAPVLNGVRAGAGVPLKFSLGGDYGLAILLAGYPASEPIACDLLEHVEPLEETVTVGKGGLSYDAASNQYTYVWKTQRAWANTCRRLVLRLDDGSTQVATFRFEK